MSTITWHKGSNWYIESDCKQYTVSKALVMGKPRYTAWHMKNIIDVVDDADEAKRICQRHKDGVTR